MTDAIRVVGLDHIVLNVRDIERSLEFYAGVLGLETVRLEEWRRKEVRFPSVRVNESMIIDLFATERTGENLNHFCLVIDPTDLEALAKNPAFDVMSEPSKRFGARGAGTSLYVRDPDGNQVELRYYE